MCGPTMRPVFFVLDRNKGIIATDDQAIIVSSVEEGDTFLDEEVASGKMTAADANRISTEMEASVLGKDPAKILSITAIEVGRVFVSREGSSAPRIKRTFSVSLQMEV